MDCVTHKDQSRNILLAGLIIAVGASAIAVTLDLSIILGAFIAGLVLGQMYFSRDLLDETSRLGESFFIPVFFVTMGMRLDLTSVFTIGTFSLALILVAGAGKMIGAWAGAKMSGLTKHEATAIGVAMMPRAEVALVLVKIGIVYNLIEDDVASSLLAMVITTTFVTPLILSRLLKRLGGELK
jgi:Kef-type K+ transport system membrane component KefB